MVGEESRTSQLSEWVKWRHNIWLRKILEVKIPVGIQVEMSSRSELRAQKRGEDWKYALGHLRVQ